MAGARASPENCPPPCRLSQTPHSPKSATASFHQMSSDCRVGSSTSGRATRYTARSLGQPGASCKCIVSVGTSVFASRLRDGLRIRTPKPTIENAAPNCQMNCRRMSHRGSVPREAVCNGIHMETQRILAANRKKPPSERPRRPKPWMIRRSNDMMTGAACEFRALIDPKQRKPGMADRVPARKVQIRSPCSGYMETPASFKAHIDARHRGSNTQSV
jgi:hypothetical protein